MVRSDCTIEPTTSRMVTTSRTTTMKSLNVKRFCIDDGPLLPAPTTPGAG